MPHGSSTGPRGLPPPIARRLEAPGAISHEVQLDKVKATAEAHGEDLDRLVIIEDWGKSGRAEKIHLRVGIARLEELVASGQVTAVYAYNMSRLGRSIETVSRLARLCANANVPIRCAEGESPDVSSSGGRLIMNILNAIHEWQADWTAERAAEAVAIRRARGDHMGPAPYGLPSSLTAGSSSAPQRTSAGSSTHTRLWERSRAPRGA